MDPELLNQYATDAGILGVPPSSAPSRESDYARDMASMVPPSALQGFTDEDLLGNFVPGYTAPITSPSQADSPPSSPEAAAPPPSAEGQGPITSPAQVSSGQSFSISHSGYSPQKAEQVARGPAGRELAATNAAIDQKTGSDFEAISNMYGMVTDQARQAQAAVTQAQIDNDIEEAKQQSLILEKRNEFATKQAELDAQIAARSAEQRANYIAALNDYRASGVDPAQLWKNLSGGEQFGMMATAFVHDFLGAKGIKTSAMDTWNKAVDRNIQAQIEKIKIKGDVAQGFKQLWDMQRADSADEREAFLRMRGFALDSMKLQVEQHMAKFRTSLTQAQGQVALSQINAALAKNIFEVFKHQDETNRALKGQALQKYGQDLQASIAREQIAASERAAARAAAAKKAEEGNPADDYIYDTSEVGGGAAIAEWRPGVTKEQRKAYGEKHATALHLNSLINQYRSLLREHGEKNLTDQGRFRSINAKRMDRLRNEILATRIKAISGAAATDAEAVRLGESAPEALWKGGDIEPILAGFQEASLNQLNQERYTVAKDFASDDPRRAIRTPMAKIAAADYADAQATERNAGQPSEKGVIDIAQLVLGPDVDRTDKAGTIDFDPDPKKEDKRDLVKEVMKQSGVDPRWSWEAFHKTPGYDRDSPLAGKITEYGAVVSGLYEAAKQGNQGAIDELKAISVLGEKAAPKVRGQQKDFTGNNETRWYAGEMARWALDQIEAEQTQRFHFQQQNSSTPGTPELDLFKQSIDAGIIPRRSE